MTTGQTDYDEQWRTLDDFITYNPGARHRRRICVQIVRTLRFSTYLDVGCGDGSLIRAIMDLAQGRIEATGVDIAASVVDKNRIKIPSARFLHFDVERDALPRQFDLIVCSEVIEHLLDREDAMMNIAAMLGRGGHLIVTCPTGRVYETERHFGHVSHPTVEELARLGSANGLSVVLSRNWGWPTYKLLKWMTNLNSRWALQAFAAGAYSWPKRAICHVLYLLNFLNATDSRRGCQLFVLFRKP